MGPGFYTGKCEGRTSSEEMASGLQLFSVTRRPGSRVRGPGFGPWSWVRSGVLSSKELFTTKTRRPRSASVGSLQKALQNRIFVLSVSFVVKSSLDRDLSPRTPDPPQHPGPNPGPRTPNPGRRMSIRNEPTHAVSLTLADRPVAADPSSMAGCRGPLGDNASVHPLRHRAAPTGVELSKELFTTKEPKVTNRTMEPRTRDPEPRTTRFLSSSDSRRACAASGRVP